jgi:hypothetical protein
LLYKQLDTQDCFTKKGTGSRARNLNGGLLSLFTVRHLHTVALQTALHIELLYKQRLGEATRPVTDISPLDRSVLKALLRTDYYLTSVNSNVD